MTLQVIEAKLLGLKKRLETMGQGNHIAYPVGPMLEIFDQYIKLQVTLRQEHLELFDDLPPRAKPFVSNYDYLEAAYVDQLADDINYCLEVIAVHRSLRDTVVAVTSEGIFFAGQYFDALFRITSIFSSARKSIVLVDGYISEDVLNILSNKQPQVTIKILTKEVKPSVQAAATAFNRQYGDLHIRTSPAFHDRFVVIDEREFFHIGASIKDAGHRGFMFSKIEEESIMRSLQTAVTDEWAKATVVV